MESVEIRFPGDLDVEARYKGHTVLTAQPDHKGENGKAPSPFDLFLVSIATCAGFYAASFCLARGIPTDALSLSLEPVRAPGSQRIETIRLRIGLPPGFPEKYERSVLRAIDQCAVKKHILDAPEFDIATVR